MFTVKYRSYSMAPAQCTEGPTNYDENEQLHGPFTLISREQDLNGYAVIYAHNGDDPGMVFGPIQADEAGKPRPILWVMNDAGATVAKYDL